MGARITMSNGTSIFAALMVELGIKIPDLIAGLAGGIVNALVFKRSDPWSIIASVTVGALTANYLAGPLGTYTGTSGGTAAFLTGVTAMALVQGVVGAAKSWQPFGRPNDVQR